MTKITKTVFKMSLDYLTVMSYKHANHLVINEEKLLNETSINFKKNFKINKSIDYTTIMSHKQANHDVIDEENLLNDCKRKNN